MSNADKLKNMNPTKIIQSVQNCAFIADSAWTETKYKLEPKTYKTLNPQNQVLAYGIFFNNLLYKYLELSDINFDDFNLQFISNQFDERQKISADEYKKMPKRYRSVFTKLNDNTYALRSQDAARPFVTVKKSDKKKLEDLLEYARKLIPVIYRTKWSTSTNSLKEPDFYKQNSFLAKFVTNRQIDTIKKLTDTFIETDSITHLYVKEIIFSNYDNMPRHGAVDIYNEYQNELTNKNRYTNAQNAINNTVAEYTGLQYLAEQADEKDRSGILVLAQRAKQNAEMARKQIIANVQNNRTK